MQVYVSPSEENWPQGGGVREHMEQLFRCFSEDDEVSRATNPGQTDIIHVESVYRIEGHRPDVYVCHGGFVPHVIPEVISNLASAKVIVSVAEWMVWQYMQSHSRRTVVIPNGVRLGDWVVRVGDENKVPGDYVLYPKGYSYYMHAFIRGAVEHPDLSFVTPVLPDEGMDVPNNVYVTGTLSRDEMRAYMVNAICILLPGPEVCPTVVLEAWACGTPVVALAGTGAEELMRYPDGRATGGVLFHSVQDVRGALAVVMKMHRRMGMAGHRKVKEHFLWDEHIWPRYKELYEAILEGNAHQFLEEKAVGRAAGGNRASWVRPELAAGQERGIGARRS
jgi:glycosyltransferase involved in cell wall biosynthesis